MNNVLVFRPKEVSMKQGVQQKLRDQKTHLLLSIAAVLVVSVLSNQWLSKPIGSAEYASQGRGIASVAANVDLKKQNQWEQQVAKDLSDKPSDGVLANKPSIRDEMVFGFLEGKYGVKTASGKVRSIEFLQMQGSEQAMFIPDRAGFLNRFKDAFAVNFEKVGMAEKSGDLEKYKLIDSKNNILGEAAFKLNSQGQVISVDVIKQ